jgi:hypothetical protein
VRRFLEQFTPIVVGVVVLIIYVVTLYPGVSGGDAGELIAAASTTGVPHPPGYPLFVLLTKPFLWLPILGPAWRANFASAVMAATAAGLLAWGVTVLTGRRWAGLAAAAAFAFSPTVWLYAVSAEVFSLNNLIIALELGLLVAVDCAARNIPADRRRIDQLVFAGAFVFGLGLSNHLTSFFFNGIFLAAMIWRALQHSPPRPARHWLVLAGCAAAGALPYVYLPLAAARHPVVAWGETNTWSGFLTHVLRREYGTFQLNAKLAAAAMPAAEQLGYYFRDLVRQVTWPGVALAAWGLLRAGADKRTRFLAAITAAAWGVYLITLHALAAFPLDQPLFHGIVARFWQAPDLVVCVWIGWGLGALRLPGSALAVTSGLLAAGQVILNVGAANHHDDVMVHDYGSSILRPLPPRALVLTRGDLITNSTRYLHDIEGLRPDLRLIDMEMLTFRWMDPQVRQQMPDITLPGTHYDLVTPGAYSLRGLIDANIGARPVVVCGGTKPGDASIAGVYRLLPIGLCDQVFPVTGAVDIPAWSRASEAARPEFHADMRLIPNPESWEHVAWADYWESLHRTALADLTLAIERDDDPVLLRSAVASFERLIAQHPQPPAYAYKNLGIARARLVPVDPSSAAAAVAAWQTYLRIGPAGDPERPAIEKAIRDLGGK